MNKIDEIALRVADKYDPRENYFPYRNDLLLYVKELLAELSNEEKPEGYALVPVEPTEAMLEAAWALNLDIEGIRQHCTNRYKAMLAAARSE